MEVEIARLPPWATIRQWARIAWVSKAAQTVWAPRMTRINQILEILELESVFRDQRHSALVFKTPDEFILLTKIVAKNGAYAIPLATEHYNKSNYNASGSTAIPGQPFRFRTIVTKQPSVWAPDPVVDELKIGELLGYPTCCSEFYKKVWVDEQWKDTTYRMFQNGGTEGPPEANILLRWLGLRFVRHLPCSFSCPGTVEVGKTTEQLAITLGFEQEFKWLREMLSWNIEWSSLHGIAIVTTPVFKFTTNTDPFPVAVTVQKIGTIYPDEGATGLKFPFNLPDKLKVTESKSFLTGIGSSRAWKDNGFTSQESMNRAHTSLIELLREYKGSVEHVLDLGCGNGLLLQRIEEEVFPGALLRGVEIDPDRVKRSIAPDAIITCGDIKNLQLWTPPEDLVIFMPGRLTEMAQEDAWNVVQQLRSAQLVLLYAYGDRASTSPFRILEGTHKTLPPSFMGPDGIRAALFSKIDG